MVRISRRNLLAGIAVTAAGGLLVSVPLIRRNTSRGRVAEPFGQSGWLRVDPGGTITVYSNVAEMGQGAISGLLQAMADELDADWADLRVEPAPVTDVFTANDGHQTGGSRSLRTHLRTFRELGARARVLLVRAAAVRWSVPESECSTIQSRVVHNPSGRRLAYRDLAADAGRLPPPRDAPLKQRSSWRYIGRPLTRLDTPAKVDGSARFGIDVDVPGMKVAAIRHCPFRDGKLLEASPEPALAIAGVSQVVRLADAVAVVADGYWQAQQGARALQPRWVNDPALRQSTEDLDSLLVQLAEQAEKKIPAGMLSALSQGEGNISASYQVPLLAQVPLEPMNATARIGETGAELWVPTQAAAQCQQQVADALGIPKVNVTVHVQMMGGGFGRRLENDYAIEAALVARAAGVPVKLIWSREEDFLRTSLRPAARALFRAKLGPDGLPEMLAISCAALDMFPQTGALKGQPYSIPEVEISYQGARTAARPGNWRSVNYSENIFFLESFIDECAAQAHRDPLEYRLEMLRNDRSATAVLHELGLACSYSTADRRRRPIGIAYCQGFGSRVAIAVELRSNGGFDYGDIACIYCVADCGLVVNPDSVRTQLEGSIFQALSAALREKVKLKDGAITTLTLSDYGLRAPRNLPAVVVKLMDSSAPDPGGVGELGIPALAPALTNAIYVATGVRHRTLPLLEIRDQSA